MRILGVSGSLREGSYNTSLLRAAPRPRPRASRSSSGKGSATCRSTTRSSNDRRARAVRRLREDWGEADAILFATPEYNGSVPGGLKNAIDWASRPRREAALRNKTVAVVGASTGQFGALWAQQDLRRILGIAGARVVGDGDPGLPRARALRQRGPAARRRALRTAPAPPDDARLGGRPVPSSGSQPEQRARRGAAFAAPLRYTSADWQRRCPAPAR